MLPSAQAGHSAIRVVPEFVKHPTSLKTDTPRLAVSRQTANSELKFDVAKFNLFALPVCQAIFYS